MICTETVTRLNNAMTNSKLLIGYGVFLFLCGLAGFISNPAAAKTALISGSVFGGLSVVWGLLLAKGFGFALVAGIFTAMLLCGVFGWRSTVSWQRVMDGDPKAFAASLITLMLIGSIATFARLLAKNA
jgi:uncharacterized membrane protein (UPF0136 family)